MWGGRFFPVAPARPTPAPGRVLVPASRIGAVQDYLRSGPTELAVLGSVARDGSALVLTFASSGAEGRPQNLSGGDEAGLVGIARSVGGDLPHGPQTARGTLLQVHLRTIKSGSLQPFCTTLGSLRLAATPQHFTHRGKRMVVASRWAVLTVSDGGIRLILELHRPQTRKTPPTRSRTRAARRVYGSVRAGLCGMLDTDFREHPSPRW